MTYLENFLERNKEKPFVRNMQKYETLSKFDKLKTLSSLFTHLCIDAENGVDNNQLLTDVLSLLNELTLYGQDNFLRWFESNLSQ